MFCHDSRTPYDPRTRGAQCDRCPLGPNGPEFVHQRGPRSWRPVPSWSTPDSFALAVGEAPAETEEQTGEPLTGPSGELHDEGICRMTPWKPRHVAKANVIECRCADNNYPAMEARLKRYNDRAPDPKDRWPHPAACCAPRLREDVRDFGYLLSYGATAAHALTGSQASMDALAGGPLALGRGEGPRRKLLPTYHPAHVLRSREMLGVWFRHLQIAARYWTDTLTWGSSWKDLHPTPDSFRAFLAQHSWVWAFDAESSSTDPRRSTVWCLSVATPKLAGPCWRCGSRKPSCPVCRGEDPQIPVHRSTALHLRSVEDGTEREGRDLLDLLRAKMQDPRTWWAGHNSTLFDAQLIERPDVLGYSIPLHRHRDSMLLAGLAYPERRRALGIVGGYKCDITAWKADNEGNKIAVNPADDQTLLTYCCTDSEVVADIIAGLAEDADAQGANRPLRETLKPAAWPPHVPWTLLEVEHWSLGHLCKGLHQAGVAIDPLTVEVHAKALAAKAEGLRDDLAAIAASYGVYGRKPRKTAPAEMHNPNSGQQVARLIYDTWGWKPLEYTETQERSVTDDVILEHLRNGDCESEDQEAYLLGLREYRSATKDRGTFVDCLTPEHWVKEPDKHGRMRWKNVGGLVQPDGRVHATWSRLPAPGRLSCSDNNQQNVKRDYRDCYVAEPGYVFVGADISAFHLNIIANHWRIPRLREVLLGRLDPHVTKACSIFGEEAVARAPGWSKGFSYKSKPDEGSDADGLRQVSKIFTYSGAYDARPSTLWRLIVTTEGEKDARGRVTFPFSHYTLKRVSAMRAKELQAEPEWEELWSGRTELYLKRRYVEEPVFHRRTPLLTLQGVDPAEIRKWSRSEIVNFEILGAEAAKSRLFEFDLITAFPFDYAGRGTGTGLVNDTHDHYVLKVREQDGERAAGVMREILNAGWGIPGWDIPTEAKVHIGRTLLAA